MKKHNPLQLGSGISSSLAFSPQISYKVRGKQSPSRYLSRRKAQGAKFCIRKGGGGENTEDDISNVVSGFKEKWGVMATGQALNQSLLWF